MILHHREFENHCFRVLGDTRSLECKEKLMRSGRTTLEDLKVVVVSERGYLPHFVVSVAPVTQNQWNAVK